MFGRCKNSFYLMRLCRIFSRISSLFAHAYASAFPCWISMNYRHCPVRSLLTVIIVAALPTVSFAQTTAQYSPELLETLTVSGERKLTAELSRQVVVKTAADFAMGARIDPAELLQIIPGVQVDSRTNYAQDTRISLRGFGARSAFGVRGIELQVDAIPM